MYIINIITTLCYMLLTHLYLTYTSRVTTAIQINPDIIMATTEIVIAVMVDDELSSLSVWFVLSLSEVCSVFEDVLQVVLQSNNETFCISI